MNRKKHSILDPEVEIQFVTITTGCLSQTPKTQMRWYWLFFV